MYKLISNHKINIKKLNKNLWIKKDQIKNLSLDGHEIGLHSFSHNTNLANESYKNQMYEYKKNLNDLKKIINKKIISCAYPSNSFDKKTIKVLKN